jgi:hypothetical protein
MDSIILSALFVILVFGVSCFLLTYLTRKVVETAAPVLKVRPYKGAASVWWNEVILFAIAPLYGIGIALLTYKTSFFPEAFRSWQAATVLGLALGSMSGLLYKVVKKLFLKEAGVDKETDLPEATVEVPGSTTTTTTVVAASTTTTKDTP